MPRFVRCLIDSSIRERLDKYGGEQANISSLVAEQSEAQRFLISVFSYISQIADILYICSVLRINPYIRFDVTLNYLTLVMYTFIEEKNLREMIEKTLICYLFQKAIDEKKFENIEFSEYCKLLKDKSLMNSVLARVRSLDVDIFKDDTSRVVSIIEEEFGIIL